MMFDLYLRWIREAVRGGGRVELRWSRVGVYVPATGARAARFMVMAFMVSARTGAITTMVPGAGFPLRGSFTATSATGVRSRP